MFTLPPDKKLGHSSGWECEVKADRLLIHTAAFKTPYTDNPYEATICLEGERLYEQADAGAEQKELVLNDSRIYSFDWGRVQMESPMLMVCRKGDSAEVLWKLKLSAYLYTEVEEVGERLFFGTAGKGGRFYCVNSASGRIIYEIVTEGTAYYAAHEDDLYLKNRLGYLTKISRNTGEVIETAEGKKMNDYSPVSIIDGHLYTIVHDRDHHAFVVCYEL